MRALRLAEHARAQERFDPMHRRLMDAYWAEARDIGSPDVLRTLATEAGVEGAEAVIAGDEYRDDVRRSTEAAHSMGINGIPAFLLGRRLLVLGAHPPETFEQAFAQLGLDAGRPPLAGRAARLGLDPVERGALRWLHVSWSPPGRTTVSPAAPGRYARPR